MVGQRLPDGTVWSGHLVWGSYWRLDGAWWAITPNGYLANLSAHHVIEHEDGAITVHPSIRVSTAQDVELWYGFLQHGVWKGR